MGLVYVRPSGNSGGTTIDFGKVDVAKVLVVGGGGREHAIVDAFSRSMQVEKVYCAPGNAGMSDIAECVPIQVSDTAGLLRFVEENHIDLTFVGPEVPLAGGIVDAFETEGRRIFGPTKAAARIESSKDFAKRVMIKYGVPTAEYRTFTSFDEALEYVKGGKFPVVLKYDGLAAGKGVTIPRSLEEAERDLRDMLLTGKFGEGKVVVEEFLSGPEFSLMAMVDGERVYPLSIAQDHKRAYDGDEGPNTGGMGAYTPVPLISMEEQEWAVEHIMKPVAKGLVEEGCPFKGVLYGGLMKTSSGIKVIEFNCRFGDPETEVVLPTLETDFYAMTSAIVDGTEMPPIKWSSKAALGYVLASKGYPGRYEKGCELEGLKEASSDVDVRIYHMGTKSVGGKVLTDGGRVLMVVGIGDDLSKARDKALEALGKVRCGNLFHRSDIGYQALGR